MEYIMVNMRHVYSTMIFYGKIQAKACGLVLGRLTAEEEIRREARKELISRIMEVPELKDKYTEEFMDTDDAWFDVTINLDRDKFRAERNKKKGEADEK